MGSAIPLHPSSLTAPGRELSFRIRRSGARRSWGLPVPTASSTVSLRGRDPLAELRLLQSFTTSRRPQVLLQLCGASHEVWSPTAHTGTAGPPIPGLPHPVCSVSRVSHPLDGFLPVRPADCFSSRKRSWGCPLQSFVPHSEAVAPFDARNPPDVDEPICTTVDRERICRRSPRPRRHTLDQPPAVPKVDRPSSGPVASLEFVSWRAGIRRSQGSMLSWGSCLSRVLRRPDLGRGVAAVPPPVGFVSRCLPAGHLRSAC